MSRIAKVGKAGATIGATMGVLAAGAAVGLAAERYMVGRSLKKADLRIDGPWRGESYDVNEIVSLYNNDKNSLIASLNYKPSNTDKWRIIKKSVKQLEYNVLFNLESSKNIYEIEIDSQPPVKVPVEVPVEVPVV